MKVQWSSTYVMVNWAKGKSLCYIITDDVFLLQHVNTFVYEMGLQEPDLSKHAKIDYLTLTSNEWSCVGQFVDLLSVHLFYISCKVITKLHYLPSSLMWLSKPFHWTRAQHFIWPFQPLKLSTKPGPLALRGWSIDILYQHWRLLQIS